MQASAASMHITAPITSLIPQSSHHPKPFGHRLSSLHRCSQIPSLPGRSTLGLITQRTPSPARWNSSVLASLLRPSLHSGTQQRAQRTGLWSNISSVRVECHWWFTPGRIADSESRKRTPSDRARMGQERREGHSSGHPACRPAYSRGDQPHHGQQYQAYRLEPCDKGPAIWSWRFVKCSNFATNARVQHRQRAADRAVT